MRIVIHNYFPTSDGWLEQIQPFKDRMDEVFKSRGRAATKALIDQIASEHNLNEAYRSMLKSHYEELVAHAAANRPEPKVQIVAPGRMRLGPIEAVLHVQREGAGFSGWVVTGYGNHSDALPNREAAIAVMLSMFKENNRNGDATTDMPDVNINGRSHWYYNPTDIKNLGNGKYEVTVPRGTYKVYGGIKAGGSRTEWYVEGPEINGALWVKSLTDAVHQIHNI